MNINYGVITFILKQLHFKKADVAIFADIIKILTFLIKTIFKDSMTLMSAELKGCVMWYIFWISFS